MQIMLQCFNDETFKSTWHKNMAEFPTVTLYSRDKLLVHFEVGKSLRPFLFIINNKSAKKML